MDWIRQLCLIRLFGDSTPLQILLAECVADGTQQPALVEPVHPFQCRKLHVACTTPALSFNDFRFVQANDAFRQCVVVGVADCTHRCFHACLLQPCAVTQRQERVPVYIPQEYKRDSGTGCPGRCGASVHRASRARAAPAPAHQTPASSPCCASPASRRYNGCTRR